MNRHERRAAAATGRKKPLIGEASDGRPEHYSIESANGLMRFDFIFGMIRPPNGEDEVSDGFKDLVAKLREVADGFEQIEASMPRLAGGGDA